MTKWYKTPNSSTIVFLMALNRNKKIADAVDLGLTLVKVENKMEALTREDPTVIGAHPTEVKIVANPKPSRSMLVVSHAMSRGPTCRTSLVSLELSLIL